MKLHLRKAHGLRNLDFLKIYNSTKYTHLLQERNLYVIKPVDVAYDKNSVIQILKLSSQLCV